MKGVASATASRVATRRNRVAFGALVLFGIALLLVGNAGAPYVVRRATLQSEIATQVRVTTGLILRNQGHARFDLLPSPRVWMTDLQISDPSGTLSVEADALRGEVRLLPLLVGRIELASATLVAPRLTIDLDGRAMPADSIIGRAMQTHPMPTTSRVEQRLGAVTLADGRAILVGRALVHPPKFSAINATVDWRDLDSPATLTGSMKVDGTDTDVAAWIEQPSALMRGDHSAGALRLHSGPLDLSANGDLVGTVAPSFKGHVSASMPSLAALLARTSASDALPAPFERLSLDSDASLGLDRDHVVALDLAKLHLRADGNTYEGTLAFQGGPHPLLSGTLASDQLVLDPFLSRLPPLLDTARHWSREPLTTVTGSPLALDMRISASHLRLAPVTIDDAALAVMTRDDRTEVGLVEGKAYGGTLKGRASFDMGAGGLGIRGSGSITDADASALSWDVFGRQLAAGTASGSASFETVGRDPAELMAHLTGWAKGRASDGEVSGADLGLGLRAFARGRIDEAAAALGAGRTPFRTMNAEARLAGGIATLGDAALRGPDAGVTLSGDVDLGARRLDLHAIAETPEIATSGPRARLPIDISGTFDQALVKPNLPAITVKPSP